MNKSQKKEEGNGQQQQGKGEEEEEEEEEDLPQISPGQCIKHYAPDRPTYLLSASVAKEKGVGGWVGQVAPRAVVVDVGGRLNGLEKTAAFYRDLSPQGDVREAAACLFEGLRWAESVGGVEREELVVLVVELREEDCGGGGGAGGGGGGGGGGGEEEGEFAMAFMDRVLRAASGRAAGPFLVQE